MAWRHVARLHYASGNFREALRVLDLGIIMGGTLHCEDLDSTVEKVAEQTRSDRVKVSDREWLILQSKFVLSGLPEAFKVYYSSFVFCWFVLRLLVRSVPQA
ncbi:hypothetical protein Fmac_021663 [Flemingia macrophylla]|uniref:DM8 domain-containing protein n=1 Tax=Flemingia macrophylla TaxID=520843 RepID=A0ABD1LXL4_9FABA